MGGLSYRVKPERINILNSYEIQKSQFIPILEEIKSKYPEHGVWNRSMKSLEREWAVHNFLYSIGFKKEKTKDVSLDYPQPWYAKIGYFIFGGISKVLIR